MAIELPQSLINIVQDNVLEREFKDALMPAQLFRREALPERWPVHLGETQWFTRDGLLAPQLLSLVPGNDPTPQNRVQIEQWQATAAQYGASLDTYMPGDYIALAAIFLRDTQKLGIQSAQSLDHMVRNRLYNAYLGGQSYITAAVTSSTTIHVAYLNGFISAMQSGRPAAVSSSNKLQINVGGTLGANNVVTGGTTVNVIAYTPDNANQPGGSGTLTLDAAVTASAGAAVFASNMPYIYRVGGGSTTNSIASSNVLTLAALRAGVTRLRKMYVPTFPDGTYHCQLDATSEAHLFNDSEFQLLNRGQTVSEEEVRNFMIARANGITFIRNEEVPQRYNTNTANSDVIYGDTSVSSLGGSPGTPVHRPIMYGPNTIREMYIDETEYITNAGALGKIGNFNVTANGLSMVTDRIRYILRTPLDRLQQVVSQTWSWSGDFAIPTDSLTGDSAAFKRAVVFEHGE